MREPYPKALFSLHCSIVTTAARRPEGTKKPTPFPNRFDRYDMETILGTMDFFGADEYFMKQTVFDLYGPPKYRLFDWLAMNIMSRNDSDRGRNNIPLKVLVHSYLKAEGDPDAFIEDLRLTDYQIDTSWEDIEIELPGEE